MHKRWILRRLPVLVLTFSIILYVDFQLRTSRLPKISADHASPGAPHRSIQQAPSPARDAPNPANGSGTHRREAKPRRGTNRSSERGHVTPSRLRLEDIFIAVKTTGRFHKTRLALLLETWISKTKTHVSL